MTIFVFNIYDFFDSFLNYFFHLFFLSDDTASTIVIVGTEECRDSCGSEDQKRSPAISREKI